MPIEGHRRERELIAHHVDARRLGHLDAEVLGEDRALLLDGLADQRGERRVGLVLEAHDDAVDLVLDADRPGHRAHAVAGDVEQRARVGERLHVLRREPVGGLVAVAVVHREPRVLEGNGGDLRVERRQEAVRAIELHAGDRVGHRRHQIERVRRCGQCDRCDDDGEALHRTRPSA